MARRRKQPETQGPREDDYVDCGYPAFSVPTWITMSDGDWVVVVGEALKNTPVNRDFHEYEGVAAGEWAAWKLVRGIHRGVKTKFSGRLPLNGLHDIEVADKGYRVVGGFFVATDDFVIPEIDFNVTKEGGVKGYVPVLIHDNGCRYVLVGHCIPHAEIAKWDKDDRGYYRNVGTLTRELEELRNAKQDESKS